MNKERKYQVCTNCVMDTTDSLIKFDINGVCDHCNSFNKKILSDVSTIKSDNKDLENLAKLIKSKNKHKKYDCVLGLSGGLDSSYLAYLVKEVMGLNPLVYIVDTGWNLDIANNNIKKIVDGLKLDYYIEKIDEVEFNDLQLAFLKSNVPYQDFPQDHAIFAGLYNFSVKNKINYVLTGANNSTEGIRPPIEWVYFNDLKLMKSIHHKFGKHKLKTFPMCGMFKYRLYYPLFKGMRRIYPLDYVQYNKEYVELFLKERFGWEKYQNKHYENIFTRFYEGYYLPQKFNFDKRKCYYSNLVITGQMTRDEALSKLKEPGYENDLAIEDMNYIVQKLGISISEMKTYLNGDKKSYKDYKNSSFSIKFALKMASVLGKEKRNFR